MDKYIFKRKLDDDKGDNDNLSGQSDPISDKNIFSSTKNFAHRKYSKDYLQYGFSFSVENGIDIPQCVICDCKLSNSCLVPSKLKRHLMTNHPSIASKDETYFKKCLSMKGKQVKAFEKHVCVSEKAQLVSYLIAELVAKKFKPHNLAEEIIYPACNIIVKTMIGESAANDICKIPFSNDTIHRRIIDMSNNIEKTTAKSLECTSFALQIDETTDITGKAQLIAFVRFIHENEIINQFLCCREIPESTTGHNIYNILNTYFDENKISWKSCIGVCTDGAPAMTGHLKGFISYVKSINPDILFTHCFLHREALVTKVLPSNLKIVLEQSVKMVNYIKSRPLKNRLFSKLCQAMEAKHQSLLLHTEVRWLSRGKVLSRVLELKENLKQFFNDDGNSEFFDLLDDGIWCARLAYLSDIFSIFNNINSSMQGENENILKSTDKLMSLKGQIAFWKKKTKEGNLEKFSSVSQEYYQSIKNDVVEHLTKLDERIIHYFPKLDIQQFDWIRDPFAKISFSHDLKIDEYEDLIKLSNDRYWKIKHRELSTNSFWVEIQHEFPKISKIALNILLQFSTSYLCELGFSSLSNIKNKKRSKIINVEYDLRVSLSTIKPNINEIIKNNQAQISH
uniref:Zinc finger BED domain-containing protein 5-like n=1 Tax=Dermatophagoides pteronyssinus TaxID=6956 RepID=A0A6P6Y811_DERPT|nr:zinc finger BED domain-containing protein 5-like [Dermatophagoides pteronyssinus]